MEVVIEIVKFSDRCYGAVFPVELTPIEVLTILNAAIDAVMIASEVVDNG